MTQTPKKFVIILGGEALRSAEGVVWTYSERPSVGNSTPTFDLAIIAAVRGVRVEDLSVEEV